MANEIAVPVQPHYTREFCEPQYDPHTTAPDGRQVMQRRLDLAARARETFTRHADIPYGRSPRERVDVYPTTIPSRGVMVFIHGGYWQRLDKADLAFLAGSFVDAGVTLVQVNYDLCPDVTLDRIVSQVRSACAWVWHHIGEYGGDRDRIYVGGNSAGGHLTAMMAATDWKSVDERLPADLMKGGLPISGIYELEPLRFTSINDAVKLDREGARRNNPANYRPTVAGPLLIPVGALESAEFQRQSHLLAQAWKEIPCRVLSVPGSHHYSILLELADRESVLFRDTLELMGIRD